jgi:outer membrane protein OmpA-like peptidoglycan-associated protein
MAAGPASSKGCPDSDGDGVLDKMDACPNVAGPVNGCPDADGDGIADKDDACPNLAGTINGCPDADGDGVADKEDACPNNAGPVNGCPDGDGDGVADKDDACPTVAARTPNGCPADPDSDGDGVPDSRDACPNNAGPINGCPDGDGDGIADKDDKCPTLGGNVTADGCPVIPERVTELFTRALQGIQFETGSNRIRSASRGIMNEVANLMKNNPTYLLTIAGHTDSIGSSRTNQRLSQRRADAVKTYLVGRGVATDRLTAVGYGEEQPVADNKYSAGRKQNRRVELSVTYRQ